MNIARAISAAFSHSMFSSSVTFFFVMGLKGVDQGMQQHSTTMDDSAANSAANSDAQSAQSAESADTTEAVIMSSTDPSVGSAASVNNADHPADHPADQSGETVGESGESVITFAKLYEDARVLATGTTIDMPLLAQSINGATHLLASRILETVPRSIVAASTMGATRCDILRFMGGDLDDVSGFPILSLVKGPRDQRIKDAGVGPTLIDILSDAMAPFSVRHVWNSRNNINRIVVFW